MRISELARDLPALFTALFIGILFIQSGLDKVLDWKGNLEWLTGHFSKTIFRGMVPLMLAKITVLEILTGLMSLAGIIYYFAAGSTVVIFYSAIMGAATITGLFLGQRIAKDYAGAAVLVPYFIVMIGLMLLSRPAAI